MMRKRDRSPSLPPCATIRTLQLWYLPDQCIEVTGVPDGDYILETIADPDDMMREADESNNCDSIRIRLSGMGTGSPSATILGPRPACSHLGR